MKTYLTGVIAPSLAMIFALAQVAHADIFQWEYVNPADPSEGRQESTLLTPDGAGAIAEPGGNLSNRNLTKAFLNGAGLGPFVGYDEYGYISSYNRSNLTAANLSQADLGHADLSAATLTGVNLTGAEVRGANFNRFDYFGYSDAYGYGPGLTLAQLSSTASFAARDLTGIRLGMHNLAGVNFSDFNLAGAHFAGADLTDANFRRANLTGASIGDRITGANFNDAEVRGATLWGISKAQLYSTASYKAHDLTGIYLYSEQSGWNFAGQNLSQATFQSSMKLNNANFTGANLTNMYLQYLTVKNANFSQANLTGADFSWGVLTGANFTGADIRTAKFHRDGAFYPASGLTQTQLQSTASYLNHDLSGVGLRGNELSDADLTAQNLANADLTGAALEGTDLAGAIVRGTLFHRDIQRSRGGITPAQLQATASYAAGDLSGIGLGGNNLAGANLVGQNLSNAVFEAETGANLTGADLSHANLTNARLGSTTLAGATLFRANLANLELPLTVFSNANMTEVNLSGSNLAGFVIVVGGEEGGYYHFPGTNMTGANLTGANLTFANFSGTDDHVFGFPHPGANFTDANLSRADARGANFRYATLTGANTGNLIQSDGHISGLNLAAGEKLVAYPGVSIPVHVSGGFSIAPDATFDLNDNDLIVRATAETKNAVHGAVQTKIIAAQNGLDANFITKWDGAGVTSSAARTANLATGFDLVGLGVIRNSDIDTITGLPGSSYSSFSGQPVTPDDMLVKYTYIGDGNFDGAVTFDDYVGMDNAFFGLTPNLGWATGDTNFDGMINFDDYTVVDQAFFFQGAPLSGGASMAAVPEPTALLLFSIGLAALIAVRRFPGARTSSLIKFQTVCIAALLVGLFAAVDSDSVARADIFQWEYVNPADPTSLKRQSTVLVPDGAGVNAVPGANLSHRDLTMAYLIGANLSGATARFGSLINAELSQANLANADFSGTFDEYHSFPTDLTGANLTGVNARGANFQVTLMNGANLSQANLTNASFNYSDLTGANFTNAEVRGAYFSRITADQLYSTASYQAHDLSGVQLEQNLGLNLAGQNLTNTLIPVTGAKLTGAVIRGANLPQITADQLYSTASYQAHDLTGVYLSGNQSGWNFAGQNLTNAVLVGNSTGADLTGADVRGAFLSPITAAQLYSTASYQARDLSGIRLFNNFMMGWNFAGQNLSNAALVANLANANLSQANLTSAWIRDATLTDANLSQANLTNANLSGAMGPYYDESGNYVGDVITPGANLTNANLSRADARGANFLYATLSGANTSNMIQADGQIAGLNLGAGETLVAFPGVPYPVHVSGGFSIDPSATFDLNDNDLIVRATAETKDAQHAAVEAKIVSAQNGHDANFVTRWDGPGVTSTSARTANVASGFDLVGLGVIRNSDIDTITGLPGSSYSSFSGQPVTPDDVLVKYTYIGDGNFDGAVTFDDYVGMDNAFFGLTPNLGWATGDINFDGAINFDDYSVVDQAFFFQGAPLTGDTSVSAVPESDTLTLLFASIPALAVGLLALGRKTICAASR